MSHPYDLKPLAKQIDDALQPGCEFVLIVVTPGDGTEKKACQYVSPMPMDKAWKTVKNFIDATRGNKLFNPDDK